MDISKELSKLNENKTNTSDLLDKFYQEQKIIEKKVHLFEVIQLAQQLKKLSTTLIEGGCEKILLINIDGDPNYSVKRSYSIELDPQTINEERLEVRDKNNNFLPWFSQLLDLYPKFSINNELTNHFTKFTINLYENIEKQLYDVLLSKELKAILDYNLLHLKLGEHNKNSKQNKI